MPSFQTCVLGQESDPNSPFADLLNTSAASEGMAPAHLRLKASGERVRAVRSLRLVLSEVNTDEFPSQLEVCLPVKVRVCNYIKMFKNF